MAKREVRIQLHRFRQMIERRLGTAPPGVAQPEHEMTPRLLIVYCYRRVARIESAIGDSPIGLRVSRLNMLMKDHPSSACALA